VDNVQKHNICSCLSHCCLEWFTPLPSEDLPEDRTLHSGSCSSVRHMSVLSFSLRPKACDEVPDNRPVIELISWKLGWISSNVTFEMGFLKAAWSLAVSYWNRSRARACEDLWSANAGHCATATALGRQSRPLDVDTLKLWNWKTVCTYTHKESIIICIASPNHITRKPSIHLKLYDLLLIDDVQSSRVCLGPYVAGMRGLVHPLFSVRICCVQVLIPTVHSGHVQRFNISSLLP
jgi:hypothetical protein